VEHLEESEKQ